MTCFTTNLLQVYKTFYVQAEKARTFHCQQGQKSGSSSSIEVHNGWLKRWSLKLPGKIRIHLSRICFAVGDKLMRRKIKDLVTVLNASAGRFYLRFWGCTMSVTEGAGANL